MVETFHLDKDGERFVVLIKDAPATSQAMRKAVELVKAHVTPRDEAPLDIIVLGYQFPTH